MTRYLQLIILFFLLCHTYIYGQAETISEGQFKYDLLEVNLDLGDEFTPADSASFIEKIASNFKKDVYFKNGYLVTEQNVGTYQLRTVMAEQLDSVYMFITGYGEATYSVYAKEDFKSKVAGALMKAQNNPEADVDTVFNTALGVNADGLDVFKIRLVDAGNDLEFEYATNLNIYTLIPIHSIPYLLDKVLTKFEFSLPDGSLIFGMKGFNKEVENDEIFKISTQGFKRRA